MIMKKMKLLSLFLCSILLAAAQETDDVKTLLNNERYASAENVLEKKIAASGHQPGLNYLLVKTYLEQDKAAEAKTFLEKTQIDKNYSAADPFDQVAYGSYLISAGQKTKAKAIIDALLEDKKNKKNEDLLLAIAEAWIQPEKGDAGQALMILELAEKRDKKNPEVDILRGKAYRMLHDGSNAYVAYQAALEKDENNVEAHYQLGKIFVTQKNEEMYMKHFNEALAIDPNYAPVLDALYDHYYFRDIEKAKKYLEQYIAHSDYSIRNEYRMADMQYLTQDYSNAIATANAVLEKEKEKAQPRLYKLIAYSYDALGDSVKALQHLEKYFEKEKSENMVSRDFEFRGKLLMNLAGRKTDAIENYKKAFELDSLADRKAGYAAIIAKAYSDLEDNSGQAEWLGKVYEWKEGRTNLDLFNWGLAHYKAGEFVAADTVFTKYTVEYPENIYGYYWLAQVNASIDTSMELGLAIPHYEKLVEIGEKDKETNKNMLAKAYGYLGGYEANTTRDYEKSLAWFEKFLELDPANEDALRYTEILRKWVAEGKNKGNDEAGNKESGETNKTEPGKTEN